MIEIVATDEFADWYRSLDDADAEAVTFSVDLLEQVGVALGRPYTGTIHGSRDAQKELRVQSTGGPMRVFDAFDPLRQAVLLIGGDKTGDKRFYEVFIPKAERLWESYLAEQAQRSVSEEDGP